MRINILAALLLVIFLANAGCLQSGGGAAADGGSTTPTVPSTPVETLLPDPVLTSANQVRIVSASPSTVQLTDAEVFDLSFVLSDPLNNSTCTWTQEIPPQALNPSGIAETTFGTLNGPCATYQHNQYSQLNFIFRVYVNNGESTTSYQWNINYNNSGVNNPVNVTAVTAEGVVRVYDSKRFEVTRDDLDGDATCSWKLNGVTMSTNCLTYTVSAASGNRTLLYTITDGVHTDTATWTIKPAAKVTALSPASANVAIGDSQTFTATLTDANASGAMCEFKIDGSLAQARGACSYTYTRSGNATHTITADAVYDAGGVERADAAKTSYALPPVNQSVSITGVTPVANSTTYLAAGATSNTFGVTAVDDADGDGWYEWYYNGGRVDCDTSSLCTYTNPALKNGIQLDNFEGNASAFPIGTVTIKVVYTDGQYSSTKTWKANLDTSYIDDSVPAGRKCNAQGTEFTVFGRGFELSDTFTLENTGIVLTKVDVKPGYAILRLPAGVPNGSQALKVTKGTNWDQSATAFVNLSSIYCN